MEHSLTGKRFKSNIPDFEDDSDYGDVTHPVGSEFIVGEDLGNADGGLAVLWQGSAVDSNGSEVPADGMCTIWTPEEIGQNATEVTL